MVTDADSILATNIVKLCDTPIYSNPLGVLLTSFLPLPYSPIYMFIPRTNGETCQPSLSCNPSDSGSTPQNSHNGTDYDDPGPERYVGVGMVAGAIVLVLVLWAWFGGWPRKVLLLLRHCRSRGTEDKRAEENGKDVLIDLTASIPNLEKPKRVRIRDSEDICGAMEQGEPADAKRTENGKVPAGRPLKRGKDSEVHAQERWSKARTSQSPHHTVR